MKKINLITIFALCFILLFMPITTYAVETSNFNTEIANTNSETINQLIRDYGVNISAYVPYTSKLFRPKTDRVDILFGNWGAFGTYTYYLEEQNSSGSWSLVDSYTVRWGSTISTSANVTPNNVYRVRATTTNTYSDQIFLEVYETIYN